MKNCSLLFLSLLFACGLFMSMQLKAQDRTVIAGIPVNYDESQTGDYKATLPDPLVMLNGKKVTTAKQWYDKRRPEILRLFEEHQYGKWPAKKPKLRYTIEEDSGFEGAAIRKQVTIFFSPDNDGPKVDVLIYIPKNANGPVPLLLNLSFSANNITVNDPGIKPGMVWDARSKTRSVATAGARFGSRMNDYIKAFLAEGFGFATLNYTDIDPDFLGGVALGVRGLYLKPGQEAPAPDEWGSISAWAWGVSHVMDYFERDPSVDAKRIAITGASRLGKTVMWTGAREPRVAMVLASCSGEGGAAISRRNYGETVAHLTEKTRYPYQFAANYGKYGADVTKLPVDANLLVALIAPRPLLLQTGTTDNWSDPKGEFFAAVEAGKVYRLLGKDDLGTTELPTPDQPIFHTLGYFMHEGGHGTVPLDWEVYLEFMKRYL
ncbi:MAG: acetylxylan esterase [Bacteroidales bacterium]|jgi:hypothetical protein|nr:acetylxylan esterase [Bacteroidales bacterium]